MIERMTSHRHTSPLITALLAFAGAAVFVSGRMSFPRLSRTSIIRISKGR
jgi:hypothetical protein